MPFPHPAIAAATRLRLDEADLDRLAEEEFRVRHSQPLGRRQDTSDIEDAKVQDFLERVGLYGTPRPRALSLDDAATVPDVMFRWPGHEKLAPEITEWGQCFFSGPPPQGYRSWRAWCAAPIKSGVTLKAS